MKALILAPFDQSVLARLRQSVEVIYECWMDTHRLLPADEFIDRIQGQDIEIVVIEADFIFREVFEKGGKLKLIAACRGNVTQVDMEAATEHGVLVVNTPARNATAVAELTVGLMLALIRKVPAAHQMVITGKWVDPTACYSSFRGSELTGKTIGIIGFGAIGQQVAKMLSAFETSILVHDPYINPDVINKLGALPQELDDLIKRSDIITLHCPVLTDTVGLMNAQRIALMKPTSYLVNTAGAAIVDQDAIVKSLKEVRIVGAAFDVYETWPVQPDNPLLKLDNVILTPHMGGATDETILRYSRMIAEDIERFIRGERPKNLLNPQAWDNFAK
ncbi:MAG: NAD(P)-dependent oxidoreductase [Dehalococcoidia bacterium]|nr:NAD(P)-dependent oxidoreductase [Dehalococcoidia bacterium]